MIMDKLMLDDNIKTLVLAVKDLLNDLRARGLNDDAIDSLIRNNGPGKIILANNGILILPDYGNMKIYLNPMERTLYTLFLKFYVKMWKRGLSSFALFLFLQIINSNNYGTKQDRQGPIERNHKERYS